jgi:hypothetical protein
MKAPMENDARLPSRWLLRRSRICTQEHVGFASIDAIDGVVRCRFPYGQEPLATPRHGEEIARRAASSKKQPPTAVSQQYRGSR